MGKLNPKQGFGTLVNHAYEGDNPQYANVSPIFQTSTFNFPDVETGAAIFREEAEGYIYTRLGNPNLDQLGKKIAVLEGLDLLREAPDKPASEIVGGLVFSSGMAAITTAVMAAVKSGETIIAQQSLYGTTYHFFEEMANRFGVKVVYLEDPQPEAWAAAFEANPDARLAYAETPSNPTISLVDLKAVADIAHQHGAWMMADNTFATPYCQRPLTLGADIVAHSTTKYLSGHGVILGGAVVSRHPEFMRHQLSMTLRIMGGSASPFDAWTANNGLKTFELRMQRHCENAMRIAAYLETHSKVGRVFYPGLESHPQHDLAKRQMHAFGGMIAFELKGGIQAGISLMDRVQVCTLTTSLGSVDTLIQHPASMTHQIVPPEERLKMGITDGLVRFATGIENVEDLIADLEQALS